MSTNRLPKIERSAFSREANHWIAFSLAIASFVVLIDLMSKWVVVRKLGPAADRTHIEIVGSFVELRYTVNSGVAFGLFHGNSVITGVLVGMVIIPMIIVLIVMAMRGGYWAIGSGLVLGGATGNLIDRIGDGSVTDFVSVGRWPLFNLADTAITIGAITLIGLSLLDRHENTTDETPHR